MTRERIHTWPKAELHCHLDGSIRLATMLDIARAEGKLSLLPYQEEEQLQQKLSQIDASENLEEYLTWFRYTIPLLQSRKALTRAIYEIAEDNARENVRYLEVRYCPFLHTADGLTIEQVHDALLEGIFTAERELYIRIGLIISAVRDQSTTASKRLAELAISRRNIGVVGFDLAGNETGNPASRHVEAFDMVREQGLNVTLHGGESVGPESIRQAVFQCGAQRIGHGTSLFQDAELLAHFREFQIPLEICPTSNVQTGVVDSFQSHPLVKYVDEGIPVTINTDNRLFSRTSVTEELHRVHIKCGVDEDSLKEIVLNGFRFAFLPHNERVDLLQSIEPEVNLA